MDVPKYLRRIRRLDPKRHDPPRRRIDQRRRLPNRRLKSFRRPNHMVGRHHDHRRIRIVAAYQQRRQPDARRRIALARLADDRRRRQFRQLLADRLHQPLVRDDQPPLLRHQIAQPIDRLPQHRLLAHQLQQLLRRIVPTRRPKPRAGPAGHDDCVKHGLGTRGLRARDWDGEAASAAGAASRSIQHIQQLTRRARQDPPHQQPPNQPQLARSQRHHTRQILRRNPANRKRRQPNLARHFAQIIQPGEIVETLSSATQTSAPRPR